MKSAKPLWQASNAKARNDLLLSIGIRQRTLTLRCFDDLPMEVKLDLNYSVELSNKPPVRSFTNSQSAGGSVASRISSAQSNPALLAGHPASFFYSQASGR